VLRILGQPREGRETFLTVGILTTCHRLDPARGNAKVDGLPAVTEALVDLLDSVFARGMVRGPQLRNDLYRLWVKKLFISIRRIFLTDVSSNDRRVIRSVAAVGGRVYNKNAFGVLASMTEAFVPLHSQGSDRRREYSTFVHRPRRNARERQLRCGSKSTLNRQPHSFVTTRACRCDGHEARSRRDIRGTL
jgi:hypothetical protein